MIGAQDPDAGVMARVIYEESSAALDPMDLEQASLTAAKRVMALGFSRTPAVEHYPVSVHADMEGFSWTCSCSAIMTNQAFGRVIQCVSLWPDSFGPAK